MKIAEHQAAQHPAYVPDAFCTTRQAAVRIGVSHRTVQMWVENGTLQAWKTAGGHRRICVASVEHLVQRRRSALAVGAAALASPAARPVIPAPTPARTAARAPRAPACAPPRSVLLVDDDAILLRLYELEISTWDMGIAVRKASNGIEALVRVGEARPDVLLSDLHMPGLDGFGMIRALRDNPRTASLPLVVISGLDKPTVLSMGLPEDVPFFTKPAPLAALRAAVTSALPPAA